MCEKKRDFGDLAGDFSASRPASCESSRTSRFSFRSSSREARNSHRDRDDEKPEGSTHSRSTSRPVKAPPN